MSNVNGLPAALPMPWTKFVFLSCLRYQVSKPDIGETRPSRVRADVTINLNMRDIVKGEWEGKTVVRYFTADFISERFHA